MNSLTTILIDYRTNYVKNGLKFTKASGAGNDFVIIDNLSRRLEFDLGQLAVALCSRHFGIGADGLLILEPSSRADFLMRYFNADGSSGGMCGNGGRCLARYAFLNHITGPHMTFEALDHIYQAEVEGNLVRLHMQDPLDMQPNISVEEGGTTFSGIGINTGSPHVVLQVPELQSLDVERLGRLIRHSRQFAPDGTNVNFARWTGGNEIEIRTYERGVEAETLACGTGSVASALAAHLQRGIGSPVKVRVRSGEVLQVRFKPSGAGFTDIYLEGSAHILFDGTTDYESLSNIISALPSDIPEARSKA